MPGPALVVRCAAYICLGYLWMAISLGGVAACHRLKVLIRHTVGICNVAVYSLSRAHCSDPWWRRMARTTLDQATNEETLLKICLMVVH